MELVNATRMSAACTLGMEPSGREHLVIVVKGTFDMPTSDKEAARLSVEQVQVTLSDVLGGESSMLPLEEADLAMRKPNCDVLLKGSAYAPRGRAARRVEVSARVGTWQKSFYVV